MLKLFICAAILTVPSLALAQMAQPQEPAHGVNMPVTLSGDEVEKAIADLQTSEIMLKVPGGTQDYIPQGARRVLMMIIQKENAARQARPNEVPSSGQDKKP